MDVLHAVHMEVYHLFQVTLNFQTTIYRTVSRILHSLVSKKHEELYAYVM